MLYVTAATARPRPDLLPRNGLARLGERLTRRGGVRQILEQLTGVLLVHALQCLGELSRDDGSRGIDEGCEHACRQVAQETAAPFDV